MSLFAKMFWFSLGFWLSIYFLYTHPLHIKIEIPASQPEPIDAPEVVHVKAEEPEQVLDAVGEYRVDEKGRAYEEHAPEFELLDLAPPGV